MIFLMNFWDQNEDSYESETPLGTAVFSGRGGDMFFLFFTLGIPPVSQGGNPGKFSLWLQEGEGEGG